MMNGSVAELLEPLFCSVEVNLNNATSVPNREIRAVPLSAILDPFAVQTSPIPVDAAEYAAVLDAIGQRVPQVDTVDNEFALTFIERSDADLVSADLRADHRVRIGELRRQRCRRPCRGGRA
jgi:hypothetical protein